jgi:hypothetical protein
MKVKGVRRYFAIGLNDADADTAPCVPFTLMLLEKAEKGTIYDAIKARYRVL